MMAFAVMDIMVVVVLTISIMVAVLTVVPVMIADDSWYSPFMKCFLSPRHCTRRLTLFNPKIHNMKAALYVWNNIFGKVMEFAQVYTDSKWKKRELEPEYMTPKPMFLATVLTFQLGRQTAFPVFYPLQCASHPSWALHAVQFSLCKAAFNTYPPVLVACNHSNKEIFKNQNILLMSVWLHLFVKYS